MATFDREFRKAFDKVVASESERARMLKEAGYDTYRDVIKEVSDSSMLSEMSGDCSNSAYAFGALGKMCEQMASTLDHRASRLDRAANQL